MPIARIQLEDGRIARVEVPDGTTAEQVMAFVKESAGGSAPDALPQQAPQTPATTEAPPVTSEPPPATNAPPGLAGAYKRTLGDASEWEKGLSLSGVMRGLTDLRDAGSQLIGRAGQAITPTGSSVNDWFKNQTQIVEDRNRKGEADYQAQRGPGAGFDSGRLAGNVLATAPLGGGVGGGLARRIAGNAAQGAALSAVSQPVNVDAEGGDSFWRQKAQQAALGGAGAVAAMPVTAALSRTVSPRASTNPNVQALLDEGVTLTPGQMGGGIVKRIEDASTSIPLLGDIVKNAQRGGIGDLNEVALNRVLEPLGEKLPKGMTGREAVDFVKRRASGAYENLLPKMSAQVDQQFVADTNKIIQNLQEVDPNIARQFGNTFQKKVVDRFVPNGQLSPVSGEMLKTIETDLGKVVAQYGGAGGGPGMYGQAIADVQDALRALITRSNPQYASELSKANEAWRNWAVIRKAAGGQGATEGVFSPNQLSAAVRAADHSKDNGNFAAGRATMQDLSDAAKAVMPSSVPDSGTPLRMMVGGAGLGGMGYLSPYLAAPGAAMASMYTPPGLALMKYLMARRPDWAPQAARGLLGATPALGAAAAPPVMGLLN